MAGRNMTLDVIVRLRDLLTGPLRRLKGGLDSIASTARKIGVVGAAVAAISFMGPIREAAAFQQQLIDIAGTQNLAGQAAFNAVGEMKSQYEALALQVGQLSDTVSKGAGQMIAAGVDPRLVDASIGVIGRAATAANAEFADMAGVATQLLTTLKIPSDQLESALGGLVVAGKEGAFELKDMAKYLPTLTGQMAKFGVTGREAVNFLGAALQVARKGTSDPAEAANNLKNFLSKILAPTTIKNFSDMGVDIQAVMQDAATKGINPIEAVVQKIVKLTGVSGDEIEKLQEKAKANGLEGADALAAVREELEKIHGAGALGNLFADIQVMDFLIPMLGNVDEYKRIKAEVAKATGSVVDRDFETQMQGLNRQLTIFGEIGTQAGREVGFAFGSWLPMINENLSAALKWLRDYDKESGGMVRQALAFAGAGVLVAAALGTIGVVLPAIGAGLSVLAALFSPVGLLFAGVAAAGVYLYKNWSTYGPMVGRLWERLKTGFSGFVDIAQQRGERLIEGGRDLARRYGPAIAQGLTTAWDNTLSAMRSFASGFAPHLGKIGEQLSATGDAIGRAASDWVRLARAIAGMINLDMGKVGNFMQMVGDWAGKGLTATAWAIREFADGMAALTKFIADLAESKAKLTDISDAIGEIVTKVTAGITWESLLPKAVIDAWSNLAAAVDRVGEAITRLKNLGWADLFKLPSFMGVPTVGPASNDNRSAVDEKTLRSLITPQGRPEMKVEGTINVNVTGPGTVTSATSGNENLPMRVNTGRAVGRD